MIKTLIKTIISLRSYFCSENMLLLLQRLFLVAMFASRSLKTEQEVSLKVMLERFNGTVAFEGLLDVE